MFPTLDIDSIVNKTIEETSTGSNFTSLGRVMVMDFNDIDGKATVKIANGKPVEAVSTAEKIQEYVKLLLRTALDKYKVYKDTEFGVSYFKYMGRRDLPMGFIQSEVKREIVEKIEKLNAVESVTDFESSLSGTTLTVQFTINLIDSTSTIINEMVVI
ncbi:MAG: DUF2634 domain-containing protein [Aminipila sp.]